MQDEYIECPTCLGTGKINNLGGLYNVCTTCNGNPRIKKQNEEKKVKEISALIEQEETIIKQKKKSGRPKKVKLFDGG